MIGENFNKLCLDIKLDNYKDMVNTANDIGNKLNKCYYEKDVNKIKIVGSVGRKTAIKDCSDLDLLYELPNDEFSRYDNYETNGQSALLQDIKDILKEKYPKTDIKGDGQVVVIDFDKYTVELVPAFLQDDGSYKYPDTHDGGSWKITKPVIEQAVVGVTVIKSSHNFINFCQLLRAWKNNVGFSFKGLLVDTLVYNVFEKNNYYALSSYDDYMLVLKDILYYISQLNRKQKYWLALGSNQEIYNDDNGLFIKKAEEAYEIICKKNVNGIFEELFGYKISNNDYKNQYLGYKNTEEFISNRFPLDIKYYLRINCVISADGIAPYKLKDFLQKGYQRLRLNRKLKFYIEDTNCPLPYDIYWKVRNVGELAKEKDQIRGQIELGNDTRIEHTNFYGPHFVECYLIKNGVCVARKKISVPIGDN